MIYLEQTVNQILREEGQTIISLEDLQISWEDVENLFIGVFDQCKGYITIYDWTEDTLSTTKQQRPEYTHIKHITLNAYNNMQRFLPDFPRQYWEFNPYTKNANSLINTNFSLEVAKYPTLENLSYSTNLNVKKEQKVHFLTPCNFYPETLQFADFICYEHCTKANTYIIEGENDVGSFDTKTLRGYIVMDKDYSGENGGVTISGGEPLAQREFLSALIDGCKAEGIHTAIETSLIYYDAEIFKKLDLVDNGY